MEHQYTLAAFGKIAPLELRVPYFTVPCQVREKLSATFIFFLDRRVAQHCQEALELYTLAYRYCQTLFKITFPLCLKGVLAILQTSKAASCSPATLQHTSRRCLGEPDSGNQTHKLFHLATYLLSFCIWRINTP